MGVYKPNAVLFFGDIKYLVVVKKKDERNLDTKAPGFYGQQFRLLGNCVSPKRFDISIEAPKRATILIDPVIDDIADTTRETPANIIGELILNEDHRTRWKEIECYVGQKFEGYVIPRRSSGVENNPTIDGNNNTVPAIDPWA